MLYALGAPVSLLVLLLAALSAVTLVGWTGSLVAARAGAPEVRAEQRHRPDPRRHVDPFGAVAAVLSGVGWARPVPLPVRRTRGQLLAATLSGPAVCAAVGAVLLVALGAVEGQVPRVTTALLQEGVAGPLLSRALLLAGVAHLAVAVLALVPLPPLPGGQLVLGVAPRTRGWQQAELYLVEKNLGVVALLVLLLLPLGGQQPPLLSVLSTVVGPLVPALTGVLG